MLLLNSKGGFFSTLFVFIYIFIYMIQIYDNVFPYNYRHKLYKDIISRDYNIGWADTNIIEHRDKVFMYSLWDIPEFIQSDFLKNSTTMPDEITVYKQKKLS